MRNGVEGGSQTCPASCASVLTKSQTGGDDEVPMIAAPGQLEDGRISGTEVTRYRGNSSVPGVIVGANHLPHVYAPKNERYCSLRDQEHA
jgi:hypothetical protein